jgi:hypothetical protein
MTQSKNVPLLTMELAERIEQSDFLVMHDRMAAIGRHEGNPYGVEIRPFGRATALLARNFPVIDFNRVYGLGPEEIGLLDEIVEFYQQGGQEFMIDIAPHRTSPELLQALAERGFLQAGFHTALYGVPDRSRVSPVAGLDVRRLEEQDVDLYGRIFTSALEIPADIPERRESRRSASV